MDGAHDGDRTRLTLLDRQVFTPVNFMCKMVPLPGAAPGSFALQAIVSTEITRAANV